MKYLNTLLFAIILLSTLSIGYFTGRRIERKNCEPGLLESIIEEGYFKRLTYWRHYIGEDYEITIRRLPTRDHIDSIAKGLTQPKL